MLLLATPLLPLSVPQAEAPAAPSLEVAGFGKTDGHATLVWAPAADGGGELRFELQSGAGPDFEHPMLRYAGPDRATFLSGLGDGRHCFRVRQRPRRGPGAWSPWSPTVEVEVRSHGLTAAWGLFAAGGLLVGAIAGFLLAADRRLQRRGAEAA